MPRSAKYSEAEAKTAKLESNAKHQREKLDRIVIQPKKDIGAKIRKSAQLSGQSLQDTFYRLSKSVWKKRKQKNCRQSRRTAFEHTTGVNLPEPHNRPPQITEPRN